ncbi:MULTISPECIES: glycosyltransferase [unclassified Microbacterium]|uniref:glycosyltransferase n=1 Tax=unclassified Microbacterium TaxID=2609290 RepID=UPI00386A72BC
MPYVSIVIPTYNSPVDGLERLVASLDAQTLDPKHVEVLFIDDGSTDDTFDRLQVIAGARPHVSARRIENSGWPSRPRNIGIDVARGDYVLFMDHDDELYPDALRAGYEFARANDADVLNGKESYTHTPHWGLETYRRDEAQSIGRTDHHPLVPMNPHKLYRREFLLEHAIRFPEGRKVLWEDQFFNIEVARHAQVVSTLASVPFYHWVKTKGSGSTLFVRASELWWSMMGRLLDWTVEQLSEEHLVAQRELLLSHQYAVRILGMFDDGYAKRPESERIFIFEQSRRVQADYDLSRFDGDLPQYRRRRAELLRDGDRTAMETLCRADTHPVGETEATSLTWRDGILHVAGKAEWTTKEKASLPLRVSGERVDTLLPDDVKNTLPASLADATAEVQAAAADLSVRDRSTRVVWLTPTEHSVEVDAAPSGTRVSAPFTGTVDPESAAMGSPLSAGYQDLFVRCQLGGTVNHRAMKSTLPATVTVARGRLHLLYPNDGGAATIFVDGAVEAVRRLSPSHPSLDEGGVLRLDLSGTHDGAGEVETTVAFRSSDGALGETSATLRIEDGAASLSVVSPAPGATLLIGDRVPGGPAGWDFTLDEDGAPRLAPARKAPAPRSARVLLLTNRDSDNVGDQIIEATAMSLIRAALTNLGVPEGDVSVNSRAAGMIPQAYLDTADPTLLADARKTIKAADVIVFGGAPVFNYRYQQFYRRTITTLELAAEYGVPVIFSSIGIEKFHEGDARAERLRAALAASTVRQITTRDDLDSLSRFVAGADIPTARVADPAVYADVVFGAPPAAPSTARPRIALVVTRQGLAQANGVPFSEKEQRTFWREAIALITKRGYDYRLLTTGHFADEMFLDAFVRAERIPKGKVVHTVNSPEELVAELRASVGVIAFRLHASITAFAYGIPSVGLSWNPKVPDFYRAVGYGGRALERKDWTAAKAVSALATAMREGVRKDPVYLHTVYAALFEALGSVVAPDGDARAWSPDELPAKLPPYPGTSASLYRERVQNKLRRIYQSYRKHRVGASPAGRGLPERVLRSGVRRARRLGGRVIRGLRRRLGGGSPRR